MIMYNRNVKVLIAVVHKNSVPMTFMKDIAYNLQIPDYVSAGFSDVGSEALLDKARNVNCKQMLLDGYDYIFCVDSDNTPDRPDALARMLAYDLPVITGLYFSRGWPFMPQIYMRASVKVAGIRIANWEDLYKPIMDYPRNELITIDGCGAGALLIRRDVLERLGDNFFQITEKGGEDFFFSQRVREELKENIYCDTGITWGHIGQTTVTERHYLRIKQELEEFKTSQRRQSFKCKCIMCGKIFEDEIIGAELYGYTHAPPEKQIQFRATCPHCGFDQKFIEYVSEGPNKSRCLAEALRGRGGKITQNVNTSEYWDNIWLNEGADTWRNYWDKFQWIVDNVPEGAKVLDVGCGVGKLMRLMKKHKNCDVYGIDISPAAIQTLFSQNMKGAVSKLPNIPYPDETFDIVTGSEIIEHLDNPEDTLRSVRRVLKPGGTFIGTSPNNTLSPEECVEHRRTWTKKEFQELFEKIFIDVQVIEMLTRQGFTPNGEAPGGGKLRPLPILIATGKKALDVKDEIKWDVPEQPFNQFQEFAEHVSEFMKEDIETVKSKMTEGSKLSKASWEKANPQTQEEKLQWYKTNTEYIYDLANWHSWPSKRFKDNYIFGLLKKEKDKGMLNTVLDYGCGIGENSIELAQLGFSVTAADVDSRVIEFAKFRAKKKGVADKIKFVLLDKPLPEDTTQTGEQWVTNHKFDAIICFDVLEHLPDAEAVRKLAKTFRNMSQNVLVTITATSQDGEFPMHLIDDGNLIRWLISYRINVIH